MAAKLSNLSDKTSEANLQVDGQVDKPAQGAADWWETEEEDSSFHHSPMWSPVQRPPLGHLNMKHCLEIQVTLTDELGDVPPPSHAWMAPVVEDMLQEARAGLTEAVVTSPGRAIPFYRTHLMGEGLKADKARDATFLLTGAVTWVGKSAYLTTNPMTIQEGKRAIAQAVSDNRVKARGPGCPWINLLAQQPFKFNTPRTSPPRDVSIHYSFDDQQTPNSLPEAIGVIGDEGTSDLSDLSSLPLPPTVVLKAIGVHCPWCLQCHPGQTTQIVPDILDEAGGTKKKCI